MIANSVDMSARQNSYAQRAQTVVLLLVGATLSVAGCSHRRVMCAADVEDVGPVVETKYRYRFTDEELKSNPKGFAALKKAYPKVFAEDGIPFNARIPYLLGSSDFHAEAEKHSYGWTGIFPYALSFFALPCCYTQEWNQRYIVDLVDAPDAHTEFSTCIRYDLAFAMWTPSPLLFYVGSLGDLGDEKNYGEARLFCGHSVVLVGDDVIGDSKINPHGDNPAYAYGLAVSLKKLEEAGLVDEWKSQHREVTASAKESPLLGADMELLEFGREQGSGFAYRFKVRHQRGELSLREARDVRKTLVKMIRDDYAASNPYAPAAMLIVDLPVYDLNGAEISGRAIVLQLDIRSLDYDPITRRGIMKIRLGEGQLDEARSYLRRNIETIVRDKGVALEPGKLPTAATFRILDEKMSDGVLEVAFKTE